MPSLIPMSIGASILKPLSLRPFFWSHFSPSSSVLYFICEDYPQLDEFKGALFYTNVIGGTPTDAFAILEPQNPSNDVLETT